MGKFSELSDREIAEKSLELLEELASILGKLKSKYPFILGK